MGNFSDWSQEDLDAFTYGTPEDEAESLKPIDNTAVSPENPADTEVSDNVSNKPVNNDNDIPSDTKKTKDKKEGFIEGFKNDWWDIKKAVAVEASHIFQKKENEEQYLPQTEWGRRMQMIYRYGAGLAGFTTGGVAGLGIKTAAATVTGLRLLGAAAPAIQRAGGIMAFLGGVTKAQKAMKAATLGSAIKEYALGGIIPSALSDFIVHRAEDNDGYFMDVFDTDNPIIKAFQSNPDDSVFLSKLKNVADGLFVGTAVGGALGGVHHVLTKSFQKLGNTMVKARKGTITDQDIKEAALNDLHFERATNNITLFERVKELEKVAADEDKALEDVIKENVHPSDRDKALELAGYITRNETPYIKEDGTICLKVEKWQDAAKVTEEELTEQLRTMDEELREAATKNKTGEIIRDGDSALSLMDKTVRETWINRKYIGDNDKLTLTNAKDIITWYKDKFKIDNNIKIKFVDGLGADGSTSGTSYLGKGKGKLPNILIQMDKNAKNPYATLRSEIEHARDLAKGQVPDQKIQHLSRYKGLNEAEIAPFYIKKKADSAQKREAPLKLKENISKYEKEGYSFKEQAPLQYDPANKVYLEKEGKRLGNLSYYVDDENCLHIEHVVNETHSLNDLLHEHDTPVKGVADRLIEKAVTNSPDVNYIIWDIAEGEAPLKLLNGFKQRHPELAKRIVSQEEYDRLAKKPARGYNNQKEGVNNNAESDRSINGTGNVAGTQESSPIDTATGKVDNKSTRKQETDVYGDTHSGGNGTNGGRSASPTDMEQGHNGNKLDGHNVTGDVKSLTETLDDTLTGKVPLDEITLEDILLKAEKEIPVSGRTFEDVKNDSEHLAETLMKLKDEGQTALLEAFYKNDEQLFDKLSRKRNAGAYVVKTLIDKAKELPVDDIDIDFKVNLYKTAQKVTAYMDTLSSGSARMTNEAKVLRGIVNAELPLQVDKQTAKQLTAFTDKLAKSLSDGITLNFTKGKVLNPAETRKTILQSLIKNDETLFMNLVNNSPTFVQDLDNLIDKYVQKGASKIDKNTLQKEIEYLIQKQSIDDFYKTVTKAGSENGILNIVRTFDFNTNAKNFVINNLLSSLGSTFRNVISGIANTVYFPILKMTAGSLSGDTALVREGFRTLEALSSYYKESMQYGFKAFKEGNGLMSNIADITEIERSYHDWKIPNGLSDWAEIGNQLQNIHSFGARLMGASDEMLSQLNYRAITRAKALEAAETTAEKLGMKNDREQVEKLATAYFNKQFDENGLPKDLNTYYEVKQQMFQTQLDGKLKDPISGDNVPIREQSTMMSLGDSVNRFVNQHWFFKAMLPFVRTSVNITQLALEHNPLYVYASPLQKDILKRGGREAAFLKAKMLFGMSSCLFGFSLASQGIVTGSSPADPKERKALYAKGWRPYSIRVGNSYVSYQGVEPLQHILAFPADMFALASRCADPDSHFNWNETFMEGFKILAEAMLDSGTFRNGVTQLSGLLDTTDTSDNTAAEKIITQYLQSYIPDVGMIRAVANTGRHNPTNSEKPWERVMNDVFAAGLGDYRRDVFGNRQDIYNVLGIARTQVTNDSGEPEYEEMERLARYGWNPTALSQSVAAGVNYSMKDFKGSDGRSAYDYILEEASTLTIDGKTLQEAVRELVTSGDYKKLPLGLNRDQTFKWGRKDNTKFNAVNDVFHDYYTEARSNFLEKYSNGTFKTKDGQTIEEIIDTAKIDKMGAIYDKYSPTIDELMGYN